MSTRINIDWSRRLHEPFVYAALLIALGAGFTFGALLGIARALGLPIGGWYSALVQAHGHAQLFGWVGLFVLGVGLYFLPRLRGTTLQGISRAPLAWSLLVAGIVLRCIVQPLAGFFGASEISSALFMLSALLETAAILVIFSMLWQTTRTAKPILPDTPVYSIERFAQIAFVSIALAFLLNLLGVWNLVSQAKSVVAPRYDQPIVTLFLYGAALPMIFVFSLRTLPLFLRLPVPTRNIWRTFALIYFLGLVLRILPFLLAIVDDALMLTERAVRANFIILLLFDALAVVGTIVLNICILFFIARLNFFQRRQLAEASHGARANYADRGEYGRFELLIYSAFVWLIVAALLDLLRVPPILNERIFVPQDAVRHALMLGGITLLIFGMAVRMLPGFSGKRAVAFPRLVLWMFVLGNLAVLFRVLPTFFGQTDWTAGLLGLSGIVGWFAVLLLAINMWKTFHLK